MEEKKAPAHEIVKTYTKDNLRIIWKPQMCAHAGICVRTLPNVYKPEEKPWVQPESATVEQLMAQIDRCPSGALSYELIDAKEEAKG
jgi:uncharacterized Fe-S cluster protein YjdI